MPAAKPNAFPPAHRIAKRREFVAMGNQRQRHDTRLVRSVIALSDNQQTHARLGITVTKRVGNAVVRNRVKRHLREAFRTTSWPAGLTIVMIATQAAADASGADLTQCVNALAQRLSRQPSTAARRP